MRSAALSGAVAALASTAVLAQTVQSPPFYLMVTSNNDTIDGQYLSACHSGAAFEGLCLSGTTSPAGTSNAASSTFYLNQTSSSTGVSPTGMLVWNLPFMNVDGSNATESEAMAFIYDVHSNVATAQFYPGNEPQYVGFDSNNAMYVESEGYDDSTFVPGVYPADAPPTALYQWSACWAILGSYYYHALAWVTAEQPHNPTCELAGVRRVFA